MSRGPALLVAAAVLLLLGGLAAAVYAYSGMAQVGADVEHRPLTHWLLQTARERSVTRQARGITLELPAHLDERLLHNAVVGYEDMCAGCHAPPGRAPSALAQGLNPPAPDLAIAARQRAPAELFWVTRHGVRMTGMPAWGKSHGDDELWTLVAFVLQFPGMSAEDYERLLEAARAAGVEHVHDLGEDEDQEHDHDHHHH